MGAGMQTLIPTSWRLLNFLETAKVVRVWACGTWLRQGPGTAMVPVAQVRAGTAKV